MKDGSNLLSLNVFLLNSACAFKLDQLQQRHHRLADKLLSQQCLPLYKARECLGASGLKPQASSEL